MPERVCRIRWRPGEPLGLTVSAKVSFLDLPLELRNQIYRDSLTEADPILVWMGLQMEDETERRAPGTYERGMHWRWQTYREYAVPDRLALGLLRCNRQIAREAAAALYRWNAFHVAGRGAWSALYVFLEMIGPANRRCLRQLEVSMQAPEKVWQHADGTRTTLGPWPARAVIPFDPRLYGVAPRREGFVDHVDPAIEACFRILGPHGPPLRLVVALEPGFLPGVPLMYDEQHPDRYTFGMDVPTAIERWRHALTTAPSGPGGSRVEVRWKGKGRTHALRRWRKRIHHIGWEFVEQDTSRVDDEPDSDDELDSDTELDSETELDSDTGLDTDSDLDLDLIRPFTLRMRAPPSVLSDAPPENGGGGTQHPDVSNTI